MDVEASRVPGRIVRPLDVVIVVASIVLPLGILLWPDVSGELQRLIFVIAYLWYANEALHLLRPGVTRQ